MLPVLPHGEIVLLRCSQTFRPAQGDQSWEFGQGGSGLGPLRHEAWEDFRAAGPFVCQCRLSGTSFIASAFALRTAATAFRSSYHESMINAASSAAALRTSRSSGAFWC